MHFTGQQSPHIIFWLSCTHTFLLSTQEMWIKWLGIRVDTGTGMSNSSYSLTLTISSVPPDHHRGELQDLLSERGIQVFCREPLHLCSLQAGGRVHLRLCHQPVLHWHRQGVSGTHAPSLPRCVQTWLLHYQLLPGLHHGLPVSGAREQSSGG